MNFIGDLSHKDGMVLQSFGMRSRRILEFGAGGSTQIFAQCQPDVLISVETVQEWIDKTKKNLERYKPRTDAIFVQYGSHPRTTYDLIFVDGVWDLRRDFAQSTWPLLDQDGVMIFHDVRRWFDAHNTFDVAKLFWDEVATVDMSYNDSNCAIIKKRKKIEYVNWNETEGKPKWAYGIGEIPEGE